MDPYFAFSRSSRLTRPPNNTRKEACLACRQRKKRCDGIVPVCTTCSKWNLKCIYRSSLEYQSHRQSPRADASAATTPVSTNARSWANEHEIAPHINHTDNRSLSYQQAPTPPLDYDEYIDQVAWEGADNYTVSKPMGMFESEAPPVASVVSTDASISLPPEAEILEMVNTFFDKYCHLLPCLSQKRFRATTDLADQNSKSPLLWIICAVFCMGTSDTKHTAYQLPYLQEAKRLLERNINSNMLPVQSLQAAVWIIFCLLVSRQLSGASVYLGKAYRYACCHGFQRIDSQRKVPGSSIIANKAAFVVEECRKVMWTLYLIDRQASCLTGNPMVIDDRYFAVDFPMDDEHFQNTVELDPGQVPNEPFTHDLKVLTANKPLHTISATIMRLIYKSMVVLGRITDYHNTEQQQSTTTETKAAGFRALENAVTRFWLSMPVATIYDVPARDLDRFVWLMFNLHMCSILLHHSAPADVSAPAASSEPPGFLRSWGSVQTVMAVINQIAPLSITPLLNPFLGPIYFLCGRFLAIRWVETQLPCHRNDLDLILLLLEKIGQTWKPLADKWKRSIELDLAKSKTEVMAMKVGVGNYMEPTCYA